MAILHDLYNWVLGWADSPYGAWALFSLAFAESSFFPIPPDVLLMALTLGDPDRAMLFAAVCTAGSVAGGAVGYLIGYLGGRPLLEWWLHHDKVMRIHNAFERYEVWAIAIAGFTPIPYKVFTIGSGAFFIDFPKFVLVSALSRGGRFFLVAGILQWLGPGLKDFIETYFNLLTILFFVLLIGGFYAVRHQARRHAAPAGGADEPGD
jgi:membrane protein YqaA with SNARE-associated domain